jgi:RNA polymerase sigma factor (sigma-70 family)
MARERLGTVLRNVRQVSVAQGAQGLGDSVLLQRFQAQQDEDAFAVLVQRHGRLVLGVCRRVLRHDQDAEDAFQAVFLALARCASSIRKPDALASWLHGVAYRTAMGLKRVAARRRAHERRVEAMSHEAHLSPPALGELQAILDEEVNRLPEKYRAPFVLCCLEGKTKAETARALGWKEGTVSSRLAQSRKLLQQRLSLRGVTLSAVICATEVTREAAQAAAPAALVAATVRAAQLFRVGNAVASAAVSTRAATLAERMIQTMRLARLKSTVFVLLTAGLLACGAGLMTHWASAQKPANAPPPQARRAEPPKPEGRPVRADRHGDPLPEYALARLGTVRFRHNGSVDAIAISPDGKTLFGGGGLSVRAWDAATGKERRRFDFDGAPEEYMEVIALSPDGKTLAACGCYTICLWEVESGKQLRHWKVTIERVAPLAWRRPRGYAFLAFTPDGKTLLSRGPTGRGLYLWETATGKEVRRFDEHWGVITFRAHALSPNGKTVAVVYEDEPKKARQVRLWDVTTGKELLALPGDQARAACLAFSPDGKTLATGHEGRPDGAVVLHDAATGKKLRSLKGDGAPWTLAFSRGGKTLAAAGAGNAILLWDLSAEKAAPRKVIRRTERPAAPIQGLAFFPDGKTLAGVSDHNTVLFWDVTTRAPVRRFDGHDRDVTAVAYSPSGDTLATASGSDGTVRLWDSGTGKERRRLPPLDGSVAALAFTPDGRAVASGHDGVIHLREVATGKSIRQFRHNVNTWAGAIAFSPDGKTLASTCGLEVRLWDVASGKAIVALKGNQDMRCLAFSPDGRTLALGSGPESKRSAIRVFDVPSGKEQQGLGRGASVNALAFSPDGRCLAAADELHVVRLWDFAGRAHRLSFPHDHEILFQESLVTSVAFSPDGRWLLAGYYMWTGETAGRNSKGESYALLWDVWTGERAGRFSGHGGTVSSVAFAPDGKTCATGSQDTTALIWDVAARLRQRKPRRLDLTTAQLNRLWTDLHDPDVARAHRAMGTLAASPEQATRLVKDRLRPVVAADPRRIAALITELDNEVFAVREKATQALEELGASAEGGLRRALAARPSPEVTRRLKQLLDKLERVDQFWVPRGVEVLERIGTREAQRVLEAMASGMPESRLTGEAKAALARLEKRKTRNCWRDLEALRHKAEPRHAAK